MCMIARKLTVGPSARLKKRITFNHDPIKLRVELVLDHLNELKF